MPRNVREGVIGIHSEMGRAIVLLLYNLGFPGYRIASLFDVADGRINEIVNPNSYRNRNRRPRVRRR